MQSHDRTLLPLAPRLLTTREAAELLNVSQRTVLNWIEQEAIPYLQLPSTGRRRDYRIPLQGLLSSLTGTYDLASELRSLDQAAHQSHVEEDHVLARAATRCAQTGEAERRKDRA